MKFTILLYLALNCPQTRVVNDTGSWSKSDQKSLEWANKRCSALFPASPCLKLFRKRAERTYWAICAADKSSD